MSNSDPMTPEQLLAALAVAGAGAGYDDQVDGWLGWDVLETRNAASGEVVRATLTITLLQAGRPAVRHSWAIEPTEHP